MSSMEGNKKERTKQKSTITRIENYVNNNEFNMAIDVNEFVVRETHLQKSFDLYNDFQSKIEDEDSHESTDRENIETQYFRICAKIKTIIQNRSRATTSASANLQQANPLLSDGDPHSRVRLPNINAPTFSGRYEDWKSFFDLFSALIHDNVQLTDVQRFLYLKGALSHEALNLIENLSLTNENYTVALDILKKRYDNNLVIINSHVKGLLEMPQITKGQGDQIRSFLTKIRQHLNSLKALKQPVDSWDILLVYIFCQKLDFQTRRAFELERDNTVLPTIEGFLDFLEKRCMALENITENEHSKYFKGQNCSKREKASTFVTTQQNFRQNCLFCNGEGHSINRCFKFKGVNLTQKREFVQGKRICYNCLGNNHTVSQCKSSGCNVCKRRHNTLLHDDNFGSKNKFQGSTSIAKNNTSQDQRQESPQINSNNSRGQKMTPTQNVNDNGDDSLATTSVISSPTIQSTLHSQGFKSQVLLATAMVNLCTRDGIRVRARAVLDSGSQSSFITSNLLEKLKVQPYKRTLTIGGIGSSITQVNEMVDIQIEVGSFKNENISTSCYILNTVTCPLPHISIDINKVSIPDNFKLADPFFYKTSEVDMLIAADIYFSLLLPGLVKLGDGLPVLQETQLGWLVCGAAPVYSNNQYKSCHFTVSLLGNSSGDKDINTTMLKFWQMEEVTNKRILSPEDRLCEQIFINSVIILNNGQYQVDLPIRNNNEIYKLGNSLTTAIKRFNSLEKRFLNNPEIYSEYKKFVEEYVLLGHARYISYDFEQNLDQDGHQRNFLPHHCVIRESSVSTKLRVVFDASAKTSTGVSLNDVMLKGFPTQPELFDILCRFRTFRYVIIADIKKMYRMIKVNPQQCFLQNIIWRDSPSEEFRCIELQTVTYGTNCAPYLATRCLNKLAEENAINFPLASQALLQQCYVDDILGGANSRAEAIELLTQLTQLLSSAGFYLHKFASNDSSLLNSNLTDWDNEIEFQDENTQNKILGLSWSPLKDSFKILAPNVDKNSKFTKRVVLSNIAKMFDPLGLIGPVVLLAKIFMQQIWVSKVDWDEEVPVFLLEKLQNFFNCLPDLVKLHIPRFMFLSSRKLVETQIHGFSDASSTAYGACIYIRAIYENGDASCNLICSKSRVAPLKTVTLPRLELCGTLLLSRLINRILPILGIDPNKVVLWTDSTIVLCWLKSTPSKWTTFVANRVSEIQELTTNFEWRHINSENNPADLVSRGAFPKDLISCKQWWNGPSFLQENKQLPSSEQNLVLSTPIPEEKKVVLVQTFTQGSVIIWSRFSNFSFLQRTVAFCFRFSNNCKLKNEKQMGPLTVKELDISLKYIIRLVQMESFSQEINYLNRFKFQDHDDNKQNSVFKSSSIKCLNPFVDTDGLLKVNGRLANAAVSYNQRFPIILPAKHHITKLIIMLEHKKLLHAGAQTVLSNLRLRYWPIHGLNLVKSVIKSCIICHRFKAKVSNQLMGCLPSDRVSISRPFLKVGVDFGGPFFIKQTRVRKAVVSKAYIALFVCMATKAIHLELVSSLSTDAFLLTLKRFISRRGCPAIIHSDNGTNFQGAKNQLRDLYTFFKSVSNLDSIKDFLSTREIEWKFIPPNSPHWGGLWEAGIKSTKTFLRKIVGDNQLTFEEFSTVLTQIEAILNSRPLCPVSSDPDDFSCLTPSHFLIGEPLTSYPERDLTNMPENRLNFWQRCTKLQQTFWKRWSIEYLNRLQNRPKWFATSKNLKVNSVVLVKEDNLPPLKWNLARILEVFPGNDGKVRVAKIRTKDGVFVRPITKLCPLPYDTN